MKKGPGKGRRHRFQQARALKRSPEVEREPCPECGAAPDADHAQWCLFEEELLDDTGAQPADD